MGIHPWTDFSRGDLPEGNGRISLVGIYRTVMEGSLSQGSIRGGWKDLARGDLGIVLRPIILLTIHRATGMRCCWAIGAELSEKKINPTGVNVNWITANRVNSHFKGGGRWADYGTITQVVVTPKKEREWIQGACGFREPLITHVVGNWPFTQVVHPPWNDLSRGDMSGLDRRIPLVGI